MRDCLSAVFLTDPNDDREALKQTKGSRVEGTCTWIKDHEVYKSWLSSDSGLLWLAGGPGKGKTMISIYLAEDLEQSVKNSHNTMLLQYFCDSKDQRRNTATAILRGLIFQLLQTRALLFTHILPSYQIQKQSLFLESSFQSLWRIFEAMLRDPVLGKTYCVLDGMDECEKNSLYMILDKFKKLFRTNPRTFQFNLIIASRDEPKAIPQLLLGFPRMRLDPDADTEINQDIGSFIEAKVNELSILGQYPPQLSEHIKKTFRDRAQGTFLWVGIVANELRNCSRTEVVKYLDLFPPGLDEIYARTLLQVELHRRETAARLLRWIVMALRPLTLPELSVALGISVDPSTIHFSPTDIAKDQVSWCGNILTVTGDEVNLIHQSAKDYLLRKDVDSNPELESFRVKEEIANTEIAGRCFDYLQEGALAGGPVDLEEDKAHLNKFPLLSYAAVSWPTHARSLARSEDMFNLSNPFYQENSKVLHSWLQTHPEGSRWLKPRYPYTLLHIASYFDVLPLAENILTKEQSQHKMGHLFLMKQDGRGNTALYIAATMEHESVTRLLLQAGADINTKGRTFIETALHGASKSGHKLMVQLLLGHRADTGARDYLGQTALHSAARTGHGAVVQLLLSNGADVEARDDGSRRTALHFAAEMGHDAVVRLLLESGADIEAKNKNQKTALHFAAQARGYCEGPGRTVRVLLEHGANIEARDNDQRTALHWAAKSGKYLVVQLLLKSNADVEAKNNRNQTALHLATIRNLRGEYKDMVLLLLNHGADIEARDNDQGTALHWAAGSGSKSVVQLLLKYNADVEAKNKYNQTALHLATVGNLRGGYKDVVLLLLDHEADTEARDNDQGTALHWAAGSGSKSVVQLLLKYNADVEAKNKYNQTALHLATQGDLWRIQGVVQLLLDHGADIEAKTPQKRTALHFAAMGEGEGTVRLLLENGANASAQDSWGQTPLDLAKNELSSKAKDRELWLEGAEAKSREATIRLLREHTSSLQDRNADPEMKRRRKG